MKIERPPSTSTPHTHNGVHTIARESVRAVPDVAHGEGRRRYYVASYLVVVVAVGVVVADAAIVVVVVVVEAVVAAVAQ